MQETNIQPVVLITGATSGIGLATAAFLAGHGFKVYGTYRTTSKTTELDQAIEKSQGCLVKILMDVTDTNSVDQAIKDILLKEKKIDVVINNAAYALTGTVESCSLEEQMALFDTNYFGIVRVLQAVLPHFREKQEGQLINIGSVVGITPFPAIENYSATKFALEGLTESMAISLSPFHIKVSIVEPGSVKTPAAVNQPMGTKDLGPDNPYEEFHRVGDQMCKESLASGQDPVGVAQLIHQVIMTKKPLLRYQCDAFAQTVAATRFKDPSGTEEVKKQIQELRGYGLLKKRIKPIVECIQNILEQAKIL